MNSEAKQGDIRHLSHWLSMCRPSRQSFAIVLFLFLNGALTHRQVSHNPDIGLWIETVILLIFNLRSNLHPVYEGVSGRATFIT